MRPAQHMVGSVSKDAVAVANLKANFATASQEAGPTAEAGQLSGSPGAAPPSRLELSPVIVPGSLAASTAG